MSESYSSWWYSNASLRPNEMTGWKPVPREEERHDSNSFTHVLRRSDPSRSVPASTRTPCAPPAGPSCTPWCPAPGRDQRREFLRESLDRGPAPVAHGDSQNDLRRVGRGPPPARTPRTPITSTGVPRFRPCSAEPIQNDLPAPGRLHGRPGSRDPRASRSRPCHRGRRRRPYRFP